MSTRARAVVTPTAGSAIGFFERWLTVWVFNVWHADRAEKHANAQDQGFTF